MDRDAALLAQDLRRERLTLVFGAAGCGKTTLLSAGVLPRLQRRRHDRILAEPCSGSLVRPESERRRLPSGADRIGEIAVYLDHWQGSPLAALQAAIHARLARSGIRTACIGVPLEKSLASWSQLLNARFLLVLDRFEDYLSAPIDKDGVGEFGEELLCLLEYREFPVNFLLCMRDQARPLMARMGARFRAFRGSVEYSYSSHAGRCPNSGRAPAVLETDAAGLISYDALGG